MSLSERPAPVRLTGRLPGATRASAARRLSVLVYGDSGVGKTRLAGTAEDDPRSAPTLFLDVEGGTLSLPNQDTDVWPVTDFEDLRPAVELIRSGRFEYRTVVLDSITRLGWATMMGLVRSPTRSGGDPDALEYGEWNRYVNKIRDLVMFFQGAGVHFIATALETEGSDKKLIPSLSGKKMREDLPAFFNTVGRLVTVPTLGPDGKSTVDVHRLHLRSSPRFVAKDRMDRDSVLSPVIDEPTVTALLDRLEATARPDYGRARASQPPESPKKPKE